MIQVKRGTALLKCWTELLERRSEILKWWTGMFTDACIAATKKLWPSLVYSKIVKLKCVKMHSYSFSHCGGFRLVLVYLYKRPSTAFPNIYGEVGGMKLRTYYPHLRAQYYQHITWSVIRIRFEVEVSVRGKVECRLHVLTTTGAEGEADVICADRYFPISSYTTSSIIPKAVQFSIISGFIFRINVS